jgi:hypothetical protein
MSTEKNISIQEPGLLPELFDFNVLELLEAEEYFMFLESQGKPRIDEQKRGCVLKIYAQFLKSRNNMISAPDSTDSPQLRKQLFDYVLQFRKLITEEIGRAAMINLFGTDEEIVALTLIHHLKL